MTSTSVAGDTSPGRRAPGPRRTIVANLVVTFGEDGRPPQAHYECHRCPYRTATVTGRHAVAEFTATAAGGAAAHRSACPALQESQ
ncbi:hypothetical protein [Streptomyces anulatus]|uniref:hypothetical protein n=1 Tax=Streptomyces anulatus TaxID=1892 RepID=UPI0032525A75|nr:hypothetical protein OH791_17230 [Streptomyces anulatus]